MKPVYGFPPTSFRKPNELAVLKNLCGYALSQETTTMQIPRYWAKAMLPCESGGRSFLLTCWKGSLNSREEAQSKADEAVRRSAEALHRGQKRSSYDYDQREIREEILEEEPGPDGTPLAVLTRNRYGSVILNADRLFFADIDLEPPTLWDRLLHLLGRPLPDRETAALEKAKRFCTGNPHWAFRVYRTFNGLRLMATHAPLDPKDAEILAVQKRLGSDRLFVHLCKRQNCFRARLSPKPWRIGVSKPEPFPREDTEAESRFRSWLTVYQRASEPMATCRFLTSFGSGRIDPGLEPLVQLHDRWTRASSGLPLA